MPQLSGCLLILARKRGRLSISNEVTLLTINPSCLRLILAVLRQSSSLSANI
ncbi:hypothetical protein [Geotalea toluenoxydans]